MNAPAERGSLSKSDDPVKGFGSGDFNELQNFWGKYKACLII